MTNDVPLPLRRNLHALVENLISADGAFVLLDFDGSLAPIEDHPDDVALPEETRDVLADLSAAEDFHVGIVSGRGLADLRGRVGIGGIAYAGNHGLEAYVDGEKTVHPIAEESREAVSRLCDELENRLWDVEGAFVEDKGVSASVHYRLVPDGDVPTVENAVRNAASDAESVHVTSGKQVLELRPDVEWDKGRAIRWLYDRLVPDDERWLPLYVGDDRTDEDAFRVLTDSGLGIKVGRTPPTVAGYRVADPDAVRRTLEWLADYGVTFLSADPDDASVPVPRGGEAEGYREEASWTVPRTL